jgi:ABC-2 type transport system permease protein
VPGVVVLISTLVTLMLTSMAVVREREIGTIEQIIVTPITRAEFIVGKTLPFALIAFGNVLTVAAFAVFWFGVPIRGNLLTLFAGTAIYFLNSIGIGLFISTVSQTQQQAMMTTFFFFFPAMLFSGFIFPIANMPAVIQWLSLLDPLRYILVIIRGVFLKGVGFDVLWPQLAALLALGLGVMSFAVTRFHKTL